MSEHFDQEALWSAATATPDDPLRRAAEAHAAGCPACAAELAEACTTLDVLAEARPEPHASIREALHAKVRTSQRRSRWAWAVAGAALALALVFALVTGDEPGLSPSLGVECWLIEQLFAASAFAAAWGIVRRWPALDAPRLAAAAALGALGGELYLHFRCGAAHALAHLLTFHVLGVATALAGAVLLGRWLLARTFAPR